LALTNYEKAFHKAKAQNDPNLPIFEKRYKALKVNDK